MKRNALKKDKDRTRYFYLTDLCFLSPIITDGPLYRYTGSFLKITYFASMSEILKSLLRDVPDFPKPGIIFKDITPLLASPEARKEVVSQIVAQFKSTPIDAIAAVEARGFLFGSLLADAMNIPFLPVRKAGKLPYHTIREEYKLEYGTACIEMHTDAVKPGWRVLVHDDLLATGGTACAAGNIIRKLGGEVAGFSFLINLSFLPGENLIQQEFNVAPRYLISY